MAGVLVCRKRTRVCWLRRQRMASDVKQTQQIPGFVYISGDWHRLWGAGFSHWLAWIPASRRLNGRNGTPRRPQVLEICLLSWYPPTTFPTTLLAGLFFDRRRVIDDICCPTVSNTDITPKQLLEEHVPSPRRRVSCQAVSWPPTALKSHATYASGLAPMTR
jgi:hypothetical protein